MVYLVHGLGSRSSVVTNSCRLQFSFVKILSSKRRSLELCFELHLNQFEPYGMEVVMKEHNIICTEDTAESVSVHGAIPGGTLRRHPGQWGDPVLN